MDLRTPEEPGSAEMNDVPIGGAPNLALGSDPITDRPEKDILEDDLEELRERVLGKDKKLAERLGDDDERPRAERDLAIQVNKELALRHQVNLHEEKNVMESSTLVERMGVARELYQEIQKRSERVDLSKIQQETVRIRRELSSYAKSIDDQIMEAKTATEEAYKNAQMATNKDDSRKMIRTAERIERLSNQMGDMLVEFNNTRRDLESKVLPAYHALIFDSDE